MSDLTRSEEHCGYTNYETFIVAIEIDNCQTLQLRFKSIADVYNRAEAIKHYIDDLWEALPNCNSVTGCLANAASERVDYRQIAMELDKE